MPAMSGLGSENATGTREGTPGRMTPLEKQSAEPQATQRWEAVKGYKEVPGRGGTEAELRERWPVCRTSG